MNATDDDDWACLTPWTDASGRALTFEQRMAHCATMLARYNDRALEEMREQLEQDGSLSIELRQAMIRKAAECLLERTAETLQRISADLALEHASGPFGVRSIEVH